MGVFGQIPNVNAHLHTSYSFSAFECLTNALEKADDENVKVVGINDFYSMDGYNEWKKEALLRHLYPLFNIEFISLQKEDQDKGIRVNDPNNPGRTYISGKGLCCPPKLSKSYTEQIATLRAESNAQVQEMCQLLNELLLAFNAGFNLNFEVIKDFFSKGQVRERHLAKALRMSAYIQFKNKPDDIKPFFEKLFNDRPLRSDIFDYAGVENEIRSNLLKAGGAAFVPEDSKTFLPMDDVCKIILAAGGIPTYPFLGDDAEGNFTDFEREIEETACILKQRGIYSVEFVSPRNSLEMLEKYAGYLHENGFIVTIGTEHNTPAMEPLKPAARGNIPLTERLKQINYEGACVIAAHQERVRTSTNGYVDVDGIANIANRATFIREGDLLIQQVIQM